MSTTLNIKTVIDIAEIRIDLAIPPADPKIRGHIIVGTPVMTKPEFKALADRNLSDDELFDELVKHVNGLGDEQTALTGEAALTECKTGHYSMYLVPAIVEGIFAQYGEARKGNSRGRR